MPATVKSLYRNAIETLRAAGVENAALDARVLLAHVLKIDAGLIVSSGCEAVADEASDRFSGLIARRAAGEPVARIVGRREFWSRDFALSPAALVPRPETETVIEAALQAIPDRNAALHVLDLGTGSGILLGAVLLEFKRATGIGVEYDVGAAQAARSNLISLGLAERAQIICGDWGNSLNAQFDLVVSNPPYIASSDISELSREVREHDPHRALDGGPDGLESYRAILADLPRLLVPSGIAILELGVGQEPAVADLAWNVHLKVNGPARCDLSGHPRALVLGRSG